MPHTVRLTTLSDERLDVFARLTEHQLRRSLEAERGILIAETRLAVESALEAGVEAVSFLVDEHHLTSCAELLERAGDMPVFVLPSEEMSQLTGYKVTRGLLCAMRRPAERSVSDVLADARHVAVIEDLVDVTNVGALFRSAAALGVDAVVLSPGCADPYCRRSVRVSMGCAFKVPWARAEKGAWPQATFDEMRAAGLEVCAMALAPEAVPLDDASLVPGAPRALVFGSEGWGLHQKTLDACDRTVIIPMAAGVDSLNVAASSAVAFWQLFR